MVTKSRVSQRSQVDFISPSEASSRNGRVGYNTGSGVIGGIQNSGSVVARGSVSQKSQKVNNTDCVITGSRVTQRSRKPNLRYTSDEWVT